MGISSFRLNHLLFVTTFVESICLLICLPNGRVASGVQLPRSWTPLFRVRATELNRFI
jgi:hypothetical protein